jgi:periplasmic protein TonB
MAGIAEKMPGRHPDVLTTALFGAAALHALIILGISFEPFLNDMRTPRSLEVLLVQQETNAERPEEADYLAQTAQDGGGESDENDRPASPFSSPLDSVMDGISPVAAQASAPEAVEATEATVITSILGENLINSVDITPDNLIQKPIIDTVVIEQDLDIARLSAEIERQQEEFAKRPRKKYLTARTHESVSAEYMYRWVERVERIGNLNYPEDVRKSELTGALVMTVGIYKNGEIESILIEESSGFSVLDASARQLVSLSGPFEPLTGLLSEETDILYITRTWEFQSTNSVISY